MMTSRTPLHLISVILPLWFKSIEIGHFSLHPLGNKPLISVLPLVPDLSLRAWKRPSVATGAGRMEPAGHRKLGRDSYAAAPSPAHLLTRRERPSLDTGLVLLSRTCLLNTGGGVVCKPPVGPGAGMG